MRSSFPNTVLELNPERLAHPILSFFRRYWETKRAGRAMPSRRDIVPSEVREHLGWMIMIDVLPGMEDFRYRLIGTLVTQYFNADSTGKLASEAWSVAGEERVRNILSLLRHIAQTRAIVHVQGAKGWATGGLEEFESLYLPLSDDGTNVSHILHIFVFDKQAVLMAREIARANGTLASSGLSRRDSSAVH